ncbi:MAG: PD40 domain-containing protein [Phycisphaerales bacterium]|nr:MAG: PD40 domain-containing protein [Phycisphaerales bacterium]
MKPSLFELSDEHCLSFAEWSTQAINIGRILHYYIDMIKQTYEKAYSMRTLLRPMVVLLLVLVLSLPAQSAPLDTGVEEIIFSSRQGGAGGHWYENFGYYSQDPSKKLYGARGRLCRLNIRTGALTAILDDPDGSIRDPQVHYDAEKILISYRPGGTDYFHLYEINTDGSGLRQLTSGPFNDIEPTYLPDGRIMFCSDRSNRWVPCWYSQVAILYTCEGDGSGIQPISGNVEHDNTPWPLPDGRVIYERWEYVDRSRVAFHHLWTANPDGTGQMIFYGNLHPGTLMIDAKPIPGTNNEVVAVFSPNHGRKEHEGAIAIVTPKRGPDDLASARKITKKENFRDPYAVSRDCFLVAQGPSLLAMNRHGQMREIYRLPPELVKARVECHEPRPLRAQPREPVIPPRSNFQQATGRLILQDVYAGRNMAGVKRGEIKKLLVLETLSKPINYSGKMPPTSFGGTYMLERIVGTVPVEPDGSAYMEVPALRSLFFVALDENNNSVKRMHSFLAVMPGETTSCVGCHEHRQRAPVPTETAALQALKRPPSPVTPVAGVPDVFDYPRDIQPILDKHCVECHDYDRREGGVILAGDHGPIFSHSYYTLTALGWISDGRDRLRTNLPPRTVGTSASPLMKMLDGSHYDAKLTQQEQDMIRYWIESAAVYPGTYAALGTGMIGGFPKSKLETTERKWPEAVEAAEAITRRCIGCHDKSLPMPKYISDNLDLILSNPNFNDIRIRMSRHLMFNLSRPKKSLILLAPLATEAGGYGLCKQRDGSGPVTVFAGTDDPDYEKILAVCRKGKRHLERIKRFDMPGFRPTPTYVREMKRYGILPDDLPEDAHIDVYATDRAYWRSLWWQPKAVARNERPAP